MDTNEKIFCVSCDWAGIVGQCLGGVDDPLACPECGCKAVTEKEFDAQMDRVNGEEPPEEEPTVIVDEIYLITMRSKITSLQITLKNLIDVIEAHEIESMSCDRDGQNYCDCLQDEVKKAKLVLDN